jgi:hypothetical protein
VRRREADAFFGAALFGAAKRSRTIRTGGDGARERARRQSTTQPQPPNTRLEHEKRKREKPEHKTIRRASHSPLVGMHFPHCGTSRGLIHLGTRTEGRREAARGLPKRWVVGVSQLPVTCACGRGSGVYPRLVRWCKVSQRVVHRLKNGRWPWGPVVPPSRAVHVAGLVFVPQVVVNTTLPACVPRAKVRLRRWNVFVVLVCVCVRALRCGGSVGVVDA